MSSWMIFAIAAVSMISLILIFIGIQLVNIHNCLYQHWRLQRDRNK